MRETMRDWMFIVECIENEMRMKNNVTNEHGI